MDVFVAKLAKNACLELAKSVNLGSDDFDETVLYKVLFV